MGTCQINDSHAVQLQGPLTVSARLDRSFNVPNALDSHTVLVVAVDHLVFELANFVDQDTKLIGNIGDIVIASFSPDGELLLT